MKLYISAAPSRVYSPLTRWSWDPQRSTLIQRTAVITDLNIRRASDPGTLLLDMPVDNTGWARMAALMYGERVEIDRKALWVDRIEPTKDGDFFVYLYHLADQAPSFQSFMSFEVIEESGAELVRGSWRVECTKENPCCDRAGEYNGFGSGPLLFECPKHCSCHD